MLEFTLNMNFFLRQNTNNLKKNSFINFNRVISATLRNINSRKTLYVATCIVYLCLF